MAVQKNVIKGILAGTFALMLSGCVTVPDAIKGSSPTPQQDLVRVMSAPQLYVGQEARFGGKVVAVQNPARENPPGNCYRTAGQRSKTDAGITFSRSHLCRYERFSGPGGFPWTTGYGSRANHWCG